MSDQKLDFSIRKFRLADTDAARQLSQESLRTLNTREYSQQQIEILAARYSEEFDFGTVDFMNNIGAVINALRDSMVNYDQPTAIVAHIEDRIIGHGSIRRSDWSNNSQLTELFVHPEYAGQGVDTKLLQTLETNVADNCKVINLFATLTGEPFYQANGYKTVNHSSFFMAGVRIPFIYMEKWFTTPSETEQFFWDVSQQGMRNIEWLATETEAFLRETFN